MGNTMHMSIYDATELVELVEELIAATAKRERLLHLGRSGDAQAQYLNTRQRLIDALTGHHAIN
jgi:hypothetical protein